ncbi:MAG: CNNM domain-containing protein [Bythopirellula sp.]|nr:CNNM domain-containing protein [Bythopirellula sp.]
MILAVTLFLIGIMLSAFFSGTETGFFRMTRVRLAVEALNGNRVSKALLWLGSQPSIFVATALVGTNLSHYVVSLSVVLASQVIAPNGGSAVEILETIVVAPVVFLLSDLLPKSLFYDAPNRLLKRCAIPFLICAVLFVPVTAVLWLLSRLAQMITGSASQDFSLRLARRELGDLLTEGHEAGILKPAQQSLAQAMLVVAGLPVKTFASPQGRVVRATTTMSKSDVLRIAQRHQRALLPVEDTRNKRQLVGYLRMMDLYLDNSPGLPEPLPLVELPENLSCLSALRRLGQAEDALGQVIDGEGKTVGFVTGRELRMALLRVS